MTEREQLRAGMQMFLTDATRIAAEVSEETQVPIKVLGWDTETTDYPPAQGTFTPKVGGGIFVFQVGTKENSGRCSVCPGALGSVIYVPSDYKDTPAIQFSDFEKPVPIDKRSTALRFSIGGDNTEGSGFLCRVVLDHELLCLRLMLPTDPRALDHIIWYSTDRGECS